MTAHYTKRAMVSVTGPVAGMAIACDAGAAWITQCRDPVDYVLTAGMDFAIAGEGKIVGQILGSQGLSLFFPAALRTTVQVPKSSPKCPDIS